MRPPGRSLILLAAVLLVLAALPASHADTIPFESDPSWDAFGGDPAAPPVPFLGKAMPVCLNAARPNPCPVGATVYGASNAAGWLADLAPIPGALWVWAPGVTGATAPAELAQVYFAKTFDLPGPPSGGTIALATDDLAEVLVNGVSAGVVGSVTDSIVAAAARNMLTTIDISKYLVEGPNAIVVRARNGRPDFAGCEPGPCTYAQNPAGVVFGGTLAFGTPNLSPDCSGAYASPDQLWPPNHRLASVAVGGVTDPDGDPIRITITAVAQDEPVNGTGDGDTCPDAAGIGTSAAAVRVERSGQGDGRVYHIAFLAEDPVGGQCAGQVEVCVPHDRGNGSFCGDGGVFADSIGPCDGCELPGPCDLCADRWSCADDDPCTIDLCTPEGCVHQPIGGLAGCQCLLGHPWRPPVCGGEIIPPEFEDRFDGARSIIAAADGTPSGAKSVRQALKELGKARHAARGAVRRGELSRDCADALADRVGAAKRAAGEWLRTSRARKPAAAVGNPEQGGGGSHGKGGSKGGKGKKAGGKG